MNGLICDNCGTVLAFDGRNNESSTGEESAWVTVRAGNHSFDACTRQCAMALLDDDGPLRPIIDAWLAVVSEIVRTVNGDAEDEETP